MKLTTLFLTKNNCYKSGKKHTVKGIMVHSTGANNPKLSRYVGPDDGILGTNPYNNHWNKPTPGGRSICVHAFIGKDKNGEVRTYQTLPWDMVGWHSGSGSLGSSKNANNNGYIGFEICEDGLTDRAYFDKVYQEAVELCAHLCKLYGLKPEKPVLIAHCEGHQLGIASNHGDVMHWFPKHGKNMDTFRAAVKTLLATGSTTPSPTVPAPTPTATTGEEKIWKFFKDKGLNDFAIAGLMGNLYAESGLRSNNLQNTYEKSLGMTDEQYTKAVDAGTYANFVNDSAGYGLAQWTYWSRKEALLKFTKEAKASIGDLDTQLAYLWKELQGYANTIKVLKSATSVRQASDVVLLEYERPADQSEAVKVKRAQYGQGYYDKYASKPAAPQPTPGQLYYVQTGAYSVKANADAQYQKVKAKGFDAIIKQSGNLYRVQVGAFSVKANAEAMAAKLKAKGFDTCITTTGGTQVAVGSASAATPAKTIKVGSKVKVKAGAKTYTGGNLASFVYNTVYDVQQINGDRAVIGLKGQVTAAMKLSDLILQ